MRYTPCTLILVVCPDSIGEITQKDCITVANEMDVLKGVSVEVVNMHTIKPLDEKCLSELVDVFSTVVSLEEHSILGGLGSAISEF